MANVTAGDMQFCGCDGMRPPIFGYSCWVASTPRLVNRAAIALASAFLLAVACANDPESLGQPAGSGPETIATNLDVPWGIAFLPDGSALIAERDSGAIQHMSQPGVVNNVGGVAGVAARGEGGLLGLATSGQTVFAYITTAQDNRVVTMRFDGASLSEPSPILTGIPAGSIHDGGRIAFGPDGKLYVTTGESGDPELAQDRSSLGGKILRINPTARSRPDNPDPASPVWSFGHRNIQGLAWDSADGCGSRSRREPVGRAQLDPAGRQLWLADGRRPRRHPGAGRPGGPVGDRRSVASGLAYFGGSLWVACLRGQRLYRVPVGADGSVADPAPLFVGQYGRLRTVVAAPDGALWFTTSNRDGRGSARDGDDRILQFRP